MARVSEDTLTLHVAKSRKLFSAPDRVGYRLFNLIAALLLLAFLLPFLGGIALLICLKLGSPILFRQVRAGFQGESFLLYKFRSMGDIRDDTGHLLPDERRLTLFGQLIRAFSLDELPQLWNVVTGDLNLVGPRPLVPDWLELCSKQQLCRYHVKPGITGWAQINGRNSISWEKKFELDVWYVDHRSFLLDLSILLKTPQHVIYPRGIVAESPEPKTS